MVRGYLLSILLALPVLVSIAVSPTRYISDDELKSFFEKLLVSDQNNAAKFIHLNLQARSPYNSTEDLAPSFLLSVESKVNQIPTVAMLSRLYDNYLPDAFKNEEVTAAEVKEEDEFMKAVLNTTVMSLTKSLLSSKGMAPDASDQFTNFLKKIWFTIYSRGGGKRGSSAFEHIFLGEFKKGQVSGLHNWLFFSHEESSKRLNYYGWTKKIEFPNKRGGIIKLKYAWNGLLKPAGSMFIGTSPELELSLYTVCFLARPNDRCNLAAGGKTFHIQTYAFNYLNNTLISSAYPQI